MGEMDGIQLKVGSIGDEVRGIGDALRGYLDNGDTPSRRIKPPTSKASRELLQHVLTRLEQVSTQLADISQLGQLSSHLTLTPPAPPAAASPATAPVSQVRAPDLPLELPDAPGGVPGSSRSSPLPALGRQRRDKRTPTAVLDCPPVSAGQNQHQHKHQQRQPSPQQPHPPQVLSKRPASPSIPIRSTPTTAASTPALGAQVGSSSSESHGAISPITTTTATATTNNKRRRTASGTSNATDRRRSKPPIGSLSTTKNNVPAATEVTPGTASNTSLSSRSPTQDHLPWPVRSPMVITLFEPGRNDNHGAPMFDCTYQDVHPLNERLFERFSTHPAVASRGYFKLQVRNLPALRVQTIARPTRDHATSFCYKVDDHGLVKVDTGKRPRFTPPRLPLPGSSKQHWTVEEQRNLWNSSASKPPTGNLPYVIGNPLFDDVTLCPGEKLKCRGPVPLEGINTPYVYFNLKAKTITTMHREDAHVRSENLLRSGENKFWCFVKPGSTQRLEEKMREFYPEMRTCSQSIRHLSRHIPPAVLDRWGVEYTLDYCTPGQAVVTEPGIYHQVLNLGPNYAVAINLEYQSSPDSPPDYRFCDKRCPDKFSISPEDFRLHRDLLTGKPLDKLEDVVSEGPQLTISGPDNGRDPTANTVQPDSLPSLGLPRLERLDSPVTQAATPPPELGTVGEEIPRPAAPDPMDHDLVTSVQPSFTPSASACSSEALGDRSPEGFSLTEPNPQGHPPASPPGSTDDLGVSHSTGSGPLLSPPPPSHEYSDLATCKLALQWTVAMVSLLLVSEAPDSLPEPITESLEAMAKALEKLMLNDTAVPATPALKEDPETPDSPAGLSTSSQSVRRSSRIKDSSIPTPTRARPPSRGSKRRNPRGRKARPPKPIAPPRDLRSPAQEILWQLVITAHHHITKVRALDSSELDAFSSFDHLSAVVSDLRTLGKQGDMRIPAADTGLDFVKTVLVDEVIGTPELHTVFKRLAKMRLAERIRTCEIEKGTIAELLQELNWPQSDGLRLEVALCEGIMWGIMTGFNYATLATLHNNPLLIEWALRRRRTSTPERHRASIGEGLLRVGEGLAATIVHGAPLAEFVFETIDTALLPPTKEPEVLAIYETLTDGNRFDTVWWPSYESCGNSFKPVTPFDPSLVPATDVQCEFCTDTRCLCYKTRIPRKPRIIANGSRGSGVRAVRKIGRGTLLGELCGSLVPPGSRPKEMTVPLRRPDFGNMAVADIYPTFMGNWVRLVDHSVTPNCFFRTAKMSGRWRVLLMTARELHDGEELTVKYGRGYRAEQTYSAVEGI